MAQHQLYVHLVATLGAFTPQLARAQAQLRALDQAVGDGSTKQAKALDKVGKGAAIAGGAIAVGMGLAVKAAIEWESAWAGVLKTASTDDPVQLRRLEKDLRGLASTLPATHKEIAGVAEAAGQLGVLTPDVAAFTKTMVDLGVSTNLSAEEAATGIARMTNVMQTAPRDVGRFGAALVALGNAGASTEAEILHMATRIAGAGATVGASEADILGLSNALSSMGVQAELGSGVMTRTLLEMETAAASGAEGLAGYAKIAGVSAQTFAAQWEADPIRALATWVGAAGKAGKAGENVVAMLESVGAEGTLDKQVLLALASSGDLLTKSLDLGAKSWKENAALTEEAEKRYATTESKIKTARNTLHDFAIDLGATLLPAVAAAADGIRDLAGFFAGLPGPVKDGLALLATVSGVFLLVGGGALILVPKIAAAKVALQTLGVTATATGGMLRGLLGVMGGPLGLALMAATVATGLFAKSKLDARARVDAFTQAIEADSGALGENSRKTAAATLDKDGLLETAEKLGLSLERVVDAAMGDAAAMDEVDRATKRAVAAGVGMEGGLTSQAQAAQELGKGVHQLADDSDRAMEAARRHAAATGEEDKAAEGAAGSVDQLSGALGEVAQELDLTWTSLSAFAAAQNMNEEATKELVKQVEAWGESLAGFIDPLGAYEGLLERKTTAEEEQAKAHEEKLAKEGDTWEQYVGEVNVSVTEYLAELERMVRDQEQWSTNMTLLAGKVSTGTLDELARMGPEGAPLVAKLVNASDAELARMEELFGRRAKGSVDAQAEQWRLWGELAPKLTSKIGKDAVDALSASLAKGTTTVAQIAAQYGVSLAAGVNPVIVASGGRKIVVGGDPNRGRPGPQEFSEGGPVWGAGTATSDSIDAKLSTGEYVVRASAVRSYGQEFLDAINESRFARGGLVQPLRLAAGGLATPPKPGHTKPPVSTAGTAVMQAAYEAASAKLAQASGAGGPGSVAGDGELASNAVALKKLVLAATGFRGSVGGWGTRPNPTEHDDMIGGKKASRALDFMTTNLAVGNSIAAAAETFPGTRYLIWQRKIWNPGGKKRPYTGRSPHTDHVHASVFSRGGRVGRQGQAPIRRATGGPIARAATTAAARLPVPVTRGGSLTANTRALTDVTAIRAVVTAWEAYADALAKVAERKALVADHTEARREYEAALAVSARARAEVKRTSTTKAQTSAAQALASAQLRVRQADTPNERATAALALSNAQKRVAATRTEAQAKATEKLSDALRDEQRAREAYSGQIRELRDYDVTAKREAEAAAVDRLIAKLEREAEVRQELVRVRDERQSTLNGLLDDVQRVREQEAEALESYNDKVRELGEQRLEVEQRLQRGTADAARSLAESQEQLLAGRARQFEQWSQLDQQTAVGWGNTVEQLLASARTQAEQFYEWQQQLASARGRGVSEGVIAALGLDEGPAALGQLRQFGNATAAQIAALNEAVAARQNTAAEQAHAEAVRGHGQLAADLGAAQETYRNALLAVQEEYVQAQRGIDRQLAQANEELTRRQAQLSAELANIGMTQGRSYGDALAAGLSSGIPGVVAAAQALQAAAKAAQGVGAGAPAPGFTGAIPTASLAPRAQMIGGIYTDLATGRAAFSGPNGEPGYAPAQRKAGMSVHTMPDGRQAYYYPLKTYDSGGYLEPGYTLAYNGTGARERVVGPVGSAGGGGNTEVRVFIGDRELTDLVRVTVDGTLTDRRASAAIAGRR